MWEVLSCSRFQNTVTAEGKFVIGSKLRSLIFCQGVRSHLPFLGMITGRIRLAQYQGENIVPVLPLPGMIKPQPLRYVFSFEVLSGFTCIPVEGAASSFTLIHCGFACLGLRARIPGAQVTEVYFLPDMT